MISEVATHHQPGPLPTLGWQSTPRVPAIDEGEVHVWLVPVDEHLRAQMETSLSSDETARARSYRFRRDETQFVAARGALRFLLGRYLGERAADVGFVEAPLGKPYLSPRFLSDLQFNISHSGEYALVAFGQGRELGIDIERRDPAAIDDGLLTQCLTARERSEYNRLPQEERTRFFFDTWARKEAYMKLLGDGLNLAPNGLDLAPTGSNRDRVAAYDVCFKDLPEIGGYSAALATRNTLPVTRFYPLSCNLLT